MSIRPSPLRNSPGADAGATSVLAGRSQPEVGPRPPASPRPKAAAAGHRPDASGQPSLVEEPAAKPGRHGFRRPRVHLRAERRAHPRRRSRGVRQSGRAESFGRRRGHGHRPSPASLTAARRGQPDAAGDGPGGERRPNGAGVTVALIDSGLYPSAAFAGRIQRSSTSPGPARGARLLRRLRSRHACGRTDWRAEPAMDGAMRGVAPGISFVVLKVLDAEGRGQHQRRHPRHRVRDRQSPPARHRHHQSLARPPDLRARRDRPAGSGG